MFLAKHPDNQVKIDELSTWWSEWYTYTSIEESQEIVYNQQILIRLNAFLYIKKYIQWATETKLTLIQENNKEKKFHLVVPLDFESIYQYNRTRKTLYRPIDKPTKTMQQFRNINSYIW